MNYSTIEKLKDNLFVVRDEDHFLITILMGFNMQKLI